MGRLHYLAGDESETIKMDDDALAALEEVILERFRNDEPFSFNYMGRKGPNGGSFTLWLHKYSNMKFTYDNPVVDADAALVDDFKDELTTHGGIFLD